jgi:hypothetical protein
MFSLPFYLLLLNYCFIFSYVEDDLDHLQLVQEFLQEHHQTLEVRCQNLFQLELALQLPEAVSKSVVELLVKE